MKKITMTVLMVLLMVVNVNALTITGEGYDIDSTVALSDDVEFVGVAGRIGFDFTFDTLTLTNATQGNALWWVNYGKYVFSGFTGITDVYVEQNNKFHGTTVTDVKWTDDSIILNMNLGRYEYSNLFDQSLVFRIVSSTMVGGSIESAPVPEPSTAILFGVGMVMFFGMFRRRTSQYTRASHLINIKYN